MVEKRPERWYTPVYGPIVSLGRSLVRDLAFGKPNWVVPGMDSSARHRWSYSSFVFDQFFAVGKVPRIRWCTWDVDDWKAAVSHSLAFTNASAWSWLACAARYRSLLLQVSRYFSVWNKWYDLHFRYIAHSLGERDVQFGMNRLHSVWWLIPLKDDHGVMMKRQWKAVVSTQHQDEDICN